MGFDTETLRAAVAHHGRVARVVIAEVAGSSPREPGAAMLVWPGGQSGTIGGGALEYDLATEARTALERGTDRLSRHALGPDLGQCCGGTVRVLTEIYDVARLAQLGDDEMIARPCPGTSGPAPLAVRRLLARARNGTERPGPMLIAGWMIEPRHRPDHPVWIWGAGHVGRALVGVLAGLPQLDITWVDTAPDRFPDDVPPRVRILPAADPARLVARAPIHADHFILTYSHALDLALCHGLLQHGFGHAGLIGSATKWARFRNRLGDMGHAPAQIARIACPIGAPELGKHPQAIAVGVAADILARTAVAAGTKKKDKTA